MLEITRGDSKTIKVQVVSKVNKNAVGEIFDLTDYSARLTIKSNENDPTPLLQSVVSNIPSPELGVIVFDLKPSDTSNLSGSAVYDVEIRNETDAENIKVYTVVKDSVKVVKDITTN